MKTDNQQRSALSAGEKILKFPADLSLEAFAKADFKD
jgi:hypothetical protein